MNPLFQNIGNLLGTLKGVVWDAKNDKMSSSRTLGFAIATWGMTSAILSPPLAVLAVAIGAAVVVIPQIGKNAAPVENKITESEIK